MRRVASLLPALLLCASAAAGAQGVRLSPVRANWSASGTTVTATFLIENRGAKPVQTLQRIDLPREWRLVTGNAPIAVSAGESGLLIVSAMVPVKTMAGSYQIRVALFDGTSEKYVDCDSLRVDVQPRRTIDVALVNHPTFIISGKSYDAVFTVRNRGNVTSEVDLKARSTLGSVALEQRAFRLEPNEARTVRVHVSKSTAAGMASDDVVELVAAMPGDAAPGKRASARVTVVPPASASIDDYQRVPTQLAVRAANTSGVSPYVVTGGGRLRDGGSERIDFLLKGKPGPSSIFGDRDQYRIDVRSPTWRVRGGDNLFSVSQLTAGSQEGFGLGAEKRFGALGIGGYAEQFRRSPGNGVEGGAFVSTTPADGVRLALNAVERHNTALAGRVGSASASVQRDGISLEAEIARSADSTGAAGMGRTIHLSGERRGVTFDLGHAKADENFLGPQRAARHDFLSASGSPLAMLTLNVSASAHSSTQEMLFGLESEDRLRLASAGITVADLVTIEGAGAQHLRRFGVLTDARQTSLRARVSPVVGRFGATLSAEMGRAAPDTTITRTFSDVSLNAGFNASRASITAFAEKYSGGSIVRGADPSLSVGGSASLRLGALEATVIGTASRLGTTVPYWMSNVDAQVTHTLRTGGSISLRGRVMQGGFGLASSAPAVAYLEYSMPIGLPVSRLHTPGRARGRVVDAVTGQGVANTLVRLGPQVGITDKDGRVSFGGLPAGEHRVSLAQQTSYADAVFIGDPVLRVDSGPSAPKRFTLRLARGARVELSVRRFAVTRTGIAGSPDSLVDVGPLSGTGFRLIGETDTLYRTTDEAGRVHFEDVPPGDWTVEPDGDVPSFHRFAPERLEIHLEPGEARDLEFRLIPVRREIKLMNESEEVRAMPEPPHKQQRQR